MRTLLQIVCGIMGLYCLLMLADLLSTGLRAALGG